MDGMKTARDMMAELGISRSALAYRCLVAGVPPVQRIVHGRTHNLFTPEMVALLKSYTPREKVLA